MNGETEYARPDPERERRTGAAEAVYCPGKTPVQVAAILSRIAGFHGRAMATRADRAMATAVRRRLPEAVYHETARILTLGPLPPVDPDFGPVAILTGGTGDISAAEEARVTLAFNGVASRRFYDVGVAGLHRLLESRGEWSNATALIVAAGMEGALPSVVAGLTDLPVVAVPTEIGYGVHRAGLTALSSMLGSCVPGVTVVNVGNGFGAAHAILRLRRAWKRAARS